ncbi:MAG TPA: sugar phosphate nucleotidyltransferase [Armatimonadota bacterium]|jgi:mannose-1-phosphate guanylyltransferase
MVAVFMAGGSGTRLWPLSREDNPKQLHALIGEDSLMTQTVTRVLPLVSAEDVWIVTNARYVDRIAEHAPGVPRDHVIGEPFALGTNLAVGLAAIHVAKQDPDAIMFVGWADSYIENGDAFLAALSLAEKAARECDGVVLGVRPTYAATGYGYIEIGRPLSGCEGACRIAQFLEKPDQETAEEFLQSGRYLWNPGISVWKASALLDLMKHCKTDHYEALMEVSAVLGTPQEQEVMERVLRPLDKDAIDTAIFEKASNLATVAVDLGWSDVGSWASLFDVLAPEGGNVTRGPVIAVDTENCLIFGQDRLIGTLGVSDLVIVDAGDAILVARKEDAERLKDLHQTIRDAGHPEYL